MTEKLYLHAHEINRVKMLDTIAKRVIEEGGQIVKNRYWKEIEMHGLYNVSELMSNLESTKKVLNDIESGKIERSEKAVNMLKKHFENTSKDLETARAAQEQPLYINKYASVSWCSLSLAFTLNNIYYSVSLDSNPFFPVNYTKAHIINNQYKNCYVEELENAPVYDEMLRFNCSDETISFTANVWFSELINASFNKVYQESNRRRVSNYYNNGYHYETIYQPVKMIDINR